MQGGQIEKREGRKSVGTERLLNEARQYSIPLSRLHPTAMTLAEEISPISRAARASHHTPSPNIAYLPKECVVVNDLLLEEGSQLRDRRRADLLAVVIDVIPLVTHVFSSLYLCRMLGAISVFQYFSVCSNGEQQQHERRNPHKRHK